MDWKTTAAALIREVAADDLTDGVIAIVEPGEIGLTLPDAVGGLHSARVYELTGCDPRGFACVVQADKFDTDVERLGAVLHELVHRIETGPFEVTTDTETEVVTERESLLLQLLLLAGRDRVRSRKLKPWHQHGHNFVRAAAVVAYRVGQVCEAVRPRHLRFSQDYFNVPETSWAAVLSDEIEQPGAIGAILATDPPEPFKQAWASVTGEVLR